MEHRQVEFKRTVVTDDNLVFFPGTAHMDEKTAGAVEAVLSRKSLPIADTVMAQEPEGGSEDDPFVMEDYPEQVAGDTFPHLKELELNDVSFDRLKTMGHKEIVGLKRIGEAKASDIEAALDLVGRE